MHFDQNLDTLFKYIGNNTPLCLLDYREKGPWRCEDRFDSDALLICDVLKNKKLEDNFNWFSFCVGLIVRLDKENRYDLFNSEFFINSIDSVKKRIDSKNLIKSDIGIKGWHVIGYESLDYFDGAKKEKISNRKNLKLKKEGLILEEDKKLFSEIAKNERFALYFLPPLKDAPGKTKPCPDERAARKRLLCKYGKSTEWCTANPTGDYADSFIYNPIYILHEFIGGEYHPIYQFTNGQFRDCENEEIYSSYSLTSEVLSFLSKNLKNLDCFYEEEEEDDYDDYDDDEDDYDDDEEDDEDDYDDDDDDDYEDDDDEDDDDEDDDYEDDEDDYEDDEDDEDEDE